MFSICILGLLALGASKTCDPWISNCLDCDESNSCIDCDASLGFTVDGKGGCKCERGYYSQTNSSLNKDQNPEDGDTECLLCADVLSHCTICENSSSCQECALPYHLDTTTGECICPESYYEDPNKGCISCSVGCLECSDSDSCITCNTDRNFADNGGNCECREGYYFEKKQEACYKCEESTNHELSCQRKSTYHLGKPLNQQTSRRLGNQDEEPSAPCTITGCVECESATECSACDISFLLSDDKTTCECPTGSILLGEFCEFPLTLYSQAQSFSSKYDDLYAQYTFSYYDVPKDSLCEPFQDTSLAVLFTVKTDCEVLNQDLIVTFYYILPVAQQLDQLYLLQYYKPPTGISFQTVLQDLNDKFSLPAGLEIGGPDAFFLECPDTLLELSVEFFDALCADESQYSWDVFGENVSSSLKSFVVAQTGLSLSVPSEILVPGTFYFTVSVNSVFSIQFFDFHVVEVKKKPLEITLTPPGPDFEVLGTESLQIEAFTPEICQGEPITYMWIFESALGRLTYMGSSNGSELNPALLQISPGSLAVGGPYTFTVLVTHALAEGETSANIHVLPSPPVAVIDLEDGEFENTSDLVIDGTGSFDSDDPGARISYSWSCEEDTGDACLNSNTLPLLGVETDGTLELSQDEIRVGAVYTFTLTVTTLNGLSDSTSVTITITGVAVGIDDVGVVANPQDNFDVCIETPEPVISFTATQNRGTPIPERRRLEARPPRELNGQNQICLTFEGSELPEGAAFGYLIEYVGESNTSGNSQVYFYTIAQPDCGDIEVYDLGDRWYINLDNCDDVERRHYPLRYDLYSTNGEKVRHLLENSRFHFKFVNNFKSGTNTLTGRVCDSLGSCTELNPAVVEVDDHRLLRTTTEEYGQLGIREYLGISVILIGGIIGGYYSIKCKKAKQSFNFDK